MNQSLLDGARRVSRTIREKNAEIRRLEIANARLVEQCAALDRKNIVLSTLMRRFARIRSLERWDERMHWSHTDGTKPPRTRTLEETDRMAKAMADKPWEVVTDL